MSKIKLLYCLGILFAIKCTLIKARPDNSNLAYDDSYKTESENQPLTPKQHLFMFTVEGFENLTSFYVNSAANISEYILKDATLLTAANHIVVQEFQNNLTNFLNKYRVNKEFEDLFELVELYSNTTSDYYEISKEQLTEDTKLIVNVLRKYGSEDLDKKFVILYEKFIREFSEEFEKVKIYLEKKMLDWFQQFKRLTDLNRRTEAFEKFVMLYL